jgi:hypothetical protein
MSNTVETSLAPIIAKVTVLDVVDTSFPDVVNVIGLIDDAIKELRERKAFAEYIALEQVKRDGPQTIGTKTWWAGPTKKYKCLDTRKTVDFLMGLDLETLGDCLSSGAIKHGAFRKACDLIGKPELFIEHFEITEDWELKDNIKQPRLQTIDTAFLR